ncbi:MAG TPA: hypothetical protein H9734_00520, partial [Candidatus Fusicatenibacter merdavium]|nr:hypothetical protein [Candidatus Fusicatenibacter merdavium]
GHNRSFPSATNYQKAGETGAGSAAAQADEEPAADGVSVSAAGIWGCSWKLLARRRLSGRDRRSATSTEPEEH